MVFPHRRRTLQVRAGRAGPHGALCLVQSLVMSPSVKQN